MSCLSVTHIFVTQRKLFMGNYSLRIFRSKYSLQIFSGGNILFKNSLFFRYFSPLFISYVLKQFFKDYYKIHKIIFFLNRLYFFRFSVYRNFYFWNFLEYASYTSLLLLWAIRLFFSILKHNVKIQGPPKNLQRSIYPISPIAHPNQTLLYNCVELLDEK